MKGLADEGVFFVGIGQGLGVWCSHSAFLPRLRADRCAGIRSCEYEKPLVSGDEVAGLVEYGLWMYCTVHRMYFGWVANPYGFFDRSIFAGKV